MKLEIIDLKATIDGKPILNGINLTVNTGETHALMGPNGSGKSTLANVIMGHPSYTRTGGRILLDGQDISDMAVDERSRAGLFLAMQYPVEIPGVTVGKFLKRAAEHHSPDKVKVSAFIKQLRQTMDEMDLPQDFINRYLNEGFSGGEKKRMEIIQMKMLRPRFAIMDETDSGLDIDALKVVAAGVNSLKGPDFGALIITHYQRILDYINPEHVHVMYKGEVVLSGGPDIVHTLEAKGYDWIKEGEAYEPAAQY